eukprot:365660-Chlamydomonas_euryale.AAC.11
MASKRLRRGMKYGTPARATNAAVGRCSTPPHDVATPRRHGFRGPSGRCRKSQAAGHSPDAWAAARRADSRWQGRSPPLSEQSRLERFGWERGTQEDKGDAMGAGRPGARRRTALLQRYSCRHFFSSRDANVWALASRGKASLSLARAGRSRPAARPGRLMHIQYVASQTQSDLMPTLQAADGVLPLPL